MWSRAGVSQDVWRSSATSLITIKYSTLTSIKGYLYSHIQTAIFIATPLLHYVAFLFFCFRLFGLSEV